MALEFRLSRNILGKLAQNIARTPPPDDCQPFEYVDRGFAILGQTLQVQNTKMEQEFLSQRQYIASEFRESEKRMEKRMDERFQRVDERFQGIDARFQGIDARFQQVDERFQQMDERIDRLEERIDKRFNALESRISRLEIRFDNFEAMRRNGRLRRMHQPINLVKTLKPIPNTNEYTWTIPRSMPKHMKSLYNLGQHAKGIFEGIWEGMTKQEKSEAERKALETIRELVEFYQISVFSDDASESDATEVILESIHVDEYMELLLDEWGIDWEKVCQLGRQHLQSRSPQAGVKREGDTSTGGDRQAKQLRGKEGDSGND